MMLVDIHHNGKLEASGIPLAQAISPNDDPDAYDAAVADLETEGVHHCGGGAAPQFTVRLHNNGSAILMLDRARDEQHLAAYFHERFEIERDHGTMRRAAEYAQLAKAAAHHARRYMGIDA